MFTLQHTDLLAQGEHLQRDIQAIAKENREAGENCTNYIHHKSAVTRCNDAPGQIRLAVQTVDLKCRQRFDYGQPFFYRLELFRSKRASKNNCASDVQQSSAYGDAYGVRSVVGSQLIHQVLDMEIDRCFGNGE
jgi:hypothetical protein